MFSIDENNNIILVRGDTLLLQIKMIKNGKPYVPQQGDSLRFAMKKKYVDDDEDVILVKTIPTDTCILELQPSDTKNLPMRSKYVYDIEFTDAQGHVDTFIKGTLIIAEEVL